ncbi:hypothetical protein Nepgr_009396 [Nepenthes gracilis]|uniref:Uncharacterized protein n=1 Tax=Nepenthes gracilis TaxID=150966 RepID=A0AAD3SAS7_NEPGR|nr:hypothetical protein Nepgr_009396 [Nepenthes gracilis]
MPPNESRHDSSIVYPDYGALDSTAVSHAFSAAFHLRSPDRDSVEGTGAAAVWFQTITLVRLLLWLSFEELD